MLNFLYGTVTGRAILKVLIRPGVSKAAGKFLSSGASRLFIASFIKKNGIDMSDYAEGPYAGFNEFFSREILPGKREVDLSEDHLISPCDCLLTVLKITPGGRFSIKDTEYSLESLLRDGRLAERFNEGYIFIHRLTVSDYHRYCFAADGVKEEQVRIPGVLHTVQPISNDYYPIYKENSREYCVIHTEQLGDIVQMEVGALLVGKIENPEHGPTVKKGTEKGFFRFGGSTIVLLIGKDRIKVRDEILAASSDGMETRVKYGEMTAVCI